MSDEPQHQLPYPVNYQQSGLYGPNHEGGEVFMIQPNLDEVFIALQVVFPVLEATTMTSISLSSVE